LLRFGTARYAARVGRAGKLRGSTRSRTFTRSGTRSVLPPASPITASLRGLRPAVALFCFSWDAVPPFPYVHAPMRSDGCLSSTTAHSTPCLTRGCPLAALLISVPAPHRVKHATPACLRGRIQPPPPPCGALPAQTTLTPSLGA